MSNPTPAPSVPAEAREPESELKIRGNIQVLNSMRELLAEYGDRLVVHHDTVEMWQGMLLADLSDDLRAQIPEMEKFVAAIEEAKKVSQELLNTEITI